MNEPHKPKLTDYLTEALAKSLTEEGRQSLLEERKLLEAEAQREQEERKLLEAEAQREQLEALQIPGATSGRSGGWGGSPDASLRCAPNPSGQSAG